MSRKALKPERHATESIRRSLAKNGLVLGRGKGKSWEGVAGRSQEGRKEIARRLQEDCKRVASWSREGGKKVGRKSEEGRKKVGRRSQEDRQYFTKWVLGPKMPQKSTRN